MTEKIRLDILLVERGLAPSREKAQALIMAGEVEIEGTLHVKPGERVPVEAAVTLKARPRFVSRGGDKLEAALSAFAMPVAGKVCVDVGASTGGFTDCLLQNGASRVYAIDVGYGQIALTLRDDPRVVVMERTNARHLVALPEPVHFVSIDASFISLTLILPAVLRWTAAPFDIVPLVKPQFEAGRRDVGKGGVVRDPKIHRRVLHDVGSFAIGLGLAVNGLIRSPLRGPAGNTEFLLWLSSTARPDAPDLDTLIEHSV